MSCASQCYVIGGPWISYDPNCPIHGDDAQRRERDARRKPYLTALASLTDDEARAVFQALDQYVENTREAAELGEPTPHLAHAETAIEKFNSLIAES